MEEKIADVQSFHIGIMPLQDALWIRGKCGFKILQYMGVGLPAVASPAGLNTELVRHGETGSLAVDAKAWQEALLTLETDADLRTRLGAGGVCRVLDRCSLRASTGKYCALLEGVGSAGREV